MAELVTAHEYLIRMVGAAWLRYADRDEREELLQTGRAVLVERAQDWDPDRGTFSGHAWLHLKKALREQIRTTRYYWLSAAEFEARPAARDGGRAPAGAHGSFDPLRRRPVSAEALLDAAYELDDLMAKPHAHDCAPEDVRRLAALLAPLNARQRRLVTRYLGLDGQPRARSLASAGEEIGLGRQAARTLYDSAMRALEAAWQDCDGWPVAP